MVANALISNDSIRIERAAQMDIDMPERGICPTKLLRSPDQSISEPQKVTMFHSGFHGASIFFFKSIKSVLKHKVLQ